MNKLQEFYRKYRQYIGTDALMYGVFILALALMFLFSDRGYSFPYCTPSPRSLRKRLRASAT